MKKMNFWKDFLAGGCIGIALVCLSYFLVNIVLEGMSPELLEQITSFVIIFFWTGICFGFAFSRIRKHNVISKDVSERKKFMKTQIYVMAIFIVIAMAIGIICAVQKNVVATLFCSMFTFVFLLWEMGCLLGYTYLRKNKEKK